MESGHPTHRSCVCAVQVVFKHDNASGKSRQYDGRVCSFLSGLWCKHAHQTFLGPVDVCLPGALSRENTWPEHTHHPLTGLESSCSRSAFDNLCHSCRAALQSHLCLEEQDRLLSPASQWPVKATSYASLIWYGIYSVLQCNIPTIWNLPQECMGKGCLFIKHCGKL